MVVACKLYVGDKHVGWGWIEPDATFFERIHPDDMQLAHEKAEAAMANGDEMIEAMELRVQRFNRQRNGNFVLEGG